MCLLLTVISSYVQCNDSGDPLDLCRVIGMVVRSLALFSGSKVEMLRERAGTKKSTNTTHVTYSLPPYRGPLPPVYPPCGRVCECYALQYSLLLRTTITRSGAPPYESFRRHL
jgi:hypothetical protein